jgi:hypothetical protein
MREERVSSRCLFSMWWGTIEERFSSRRLTFWVVGDERREVFFCTALTGQWVMIENREDHGSL